MSESKTKGFLDKFNSVASTLKDYGSEPWLVLLNFLSNAIEHFVDAMNDKRIPKIIAFSLIQYEKELREMAGRTDTHFDDKVVDELRESVKDILK